MDFDWKWFRKYDHYFDQYVDPVFDPRSELCLTKKYGDMEFYCSIDVTVLGSPYNFKIELKSDKRKSCNDVILHKGCRDSVEECKRFCEKFMLDYIQ